MFYIYTKVQYILKQQTQPAMLYAPFTHLVLEGCAECVCVCALIRKCSKIHRKCVGQTKKLCFLYVWAKARGAFARALGQLNRARGVCGWSKWRIGPTSILHCVYDGFLILG